MLRLPSSAMRRGPAPPQKPSLCLPSAMLRSPQPEQSPGDSPVATPGGGSTTAAFASGSSEETRDSRQRRPSLVDRSRFFLEHEADAELNDVYEVEATPLGEGGFGTVWRACMRSAGEVQRAVKAVKKQSAATDVMVQEEVAILRSLDHPYICRLFETFEGAKFTYLVMEYVDGQELFDYIQEASLNKSVLDENFAAQIMRQVFSALQYCHSRSVVHRDLKPENIMVRRVTTSGSAPQLEIKLIDFGLAACWTRSSRPASGSLVGTCCYSAPEAQRGGSANPASDMWSAGMVLHTLLVGGLPDDAVCMGKEPPALSSGTYSGVSTPAKELLAGLLRAAPHGRLTASAAAACAWLRAEARAVAAPDRLDKTMNAFTRFYRSNMLRRAFLTALAMQLADQHIADLHEQFLAMDEDRNGRISRTELANAVARDCPGATSDIAEWVENVFDSVDTDGSDEIEYTEYLAAAHHFGEVSSDQAVHAAFRVLDADGSGKISVLEIARITSDTPADIAVLLPQYDLNGDGEIDLEEFRDLVLRAPPLFTPSVSTDSMQGKMSRPKTAPAAAHSRLLQAMMTQRSSQGDTVGLNLQLSPKGGDAAQRPLPLLWRSKTHPVQSEHRMIVSM